MYCSFSLSQFLTFFAPYLCIVIAIHINLILFINTKIKMKNKIQSTIDAAVNTAQKIANEVGDAIEEVVDNAVEVTQNVTQTIDTVEETVKSVSETAKEFPSLKDVIKAVSADSRVGHFIVDIVSGMNVGEASKLHFPHDDVADESQNPSIDTLVSEAEERGYLRGRNEQIEMKMRHFNKENKSPERRSAMPETTILNRPRRSVWEK